MPAVDDLASLVARLEVVADRLEAGGAGAGQEDAAASVAAYDEVMALHKVWSDLSTKIGGDVATIAAMVDQAFIAQVDHTLH